MKDTTVLTFEVRKRPKRHAIVKYDKYGVKKIVVQVTQEEMDELVLGNKKNENENV